MIATDDPLAAFSIDLAEVESLQIQRRQQVDLIIEREEQKRYLAAYRKIGQRLSAARYAKVSWGKVLRWEKDSKFKRRAKRTYQLHVEGIVREAYRRAIVGNPRMKFYKGEPCTVYNEKTGEHEPYIEYKQSDKLLVELLGVLDPRFAKQAAKTEVNISNSNSMTIGVVENPQFYGNQAHDLIGDDVPKVIEVEAE